jgi:hypothetical protein
VRPDTTTRGEANGVAHQPIQMLLPRDLTSPPASWAERQLSNGLCGGVVQCVVRVTAQRGDGDKRPDDARQTRLPLCLCKATGGLVLQRFEEEMAGGCPPQKEKEFIAWCKSFVN